MAIHFPEMRIFVAAPLTQFLDPQSNTINTEYRAWLERLMFELETGAHEIFSAHRRESWGANLDPPAAALHADVEGLRGADAIVAHVGDPPSPGVQFELGAATALGLPMIVLLERGTMTPYLLPGLSSVGRAAIIEFESGEPVAHRVEEALAGFWNDDLGAAPT
jgi:nucleoside 2-deoxyribosyltransferase